MLHQESSRPNNEMRRVVNQSEKKKNQKHHKFQPIIAADLHNHFIIISTIEGTLP